MGLILILIVAAALCASLGVWGLKLLGNLIILTVGGFILYGLLIAAP